MEPRPKRRLEQVREIMRLKHYSDRTEDSYVQWIRRYILFHNKRHPKDMGSPEVEAFLTHLAVHERVAASTQNQALSAVLFLYNSELKLELDRPVDALRAKRSQTLPTVLTQTEVMQVINRPSGVYQLEIKLLYGSGLRLTEGLRLRVKDIDFEHHQITI